MPRRNIPAVETPVLHAVGLAKAIIETERRPPRECRLQRFVAKSKWLELPLKSARCQEGRQFTFLSKQHVAHEQG